MKNYIFFIGGSGARVYRAFIHNAAAGIVRTENVTVMLVDADKSNKANTNCIELYKKYKKTYTMISDYAKERNIFTCKIDMTQEEAISPVTPDCVNLETAVGTDRRKKRILNWLYTEDEITQNLEGGFYAHPNIGCIFFADFEHDKLEECFQKIENELTNNESVNLVLVGSVFGGTGASGMPTLFKMIKRKVAEHRNYSNLKVNGVFLEPYFKVLGRPDDERDIFIDMESFYFNTYEALCYYNEMRELEFNSIYLIGQQELDIVNRQYAASGEKQDNKPHIVEVYAALAIDCCFCHPEKKGIYGFVREKKLSWKSFPEINEEVTVLGLADFVRAQTVYLSEIYNYIYVDQGKREKFKKIGVMVPPWYREYKIRETFLDNSAEDIGEYGIYFLDWIYKMNCKYNAAGELYWNEGMNLFGPVLSDVYDVSRKFGRDVRTEKAEIKKPVEEIREKFNTIVDTTSNIEYVVDKITSILSALLPLAGNSKGVGVAALFLKLLSLVSQKKS